MSARYARRQLALAALAANAIRPQRGRAAIPSFAFGWPTSELAPHLLGLAAADTAAELTVRRGKASRVGLLAAAAGAGMLAYTVAGARRTGTELDAALRAGIGEGYLEEIDLPGPLDLRLPRGSVARPFSFKQHDVEVLSNVAYTEGGRK
ncbi:MAG: alpha/beta hydrolase, partial [Aeromicrobium sp.]